MQKKDEDGFLTTSGELLRMADVQSAARRARVAGYEGQTMAKAILAGDNTVDNVDGLHRIIGLMLSDVTERGEGYPIRLRADGDRFVFLALNEGGYNATAIDAAELVAWIFSAEGRAALARRGINVGAMIAASLQLPARKEWDPETADQSASASGSSDSSYVDGWNDARDAIAATLQAMSEPTGEKSP